MPNKNYVKGVKKEYKIKKQFEMKGYTVLRTAGSHGFADLIAIDLKLKRILFIQCKPDNYSKSKEKKLLEENKCYNGQFTSLFTVI